MLVGLIGLAASVLGIYQAIPEEDEREIELLQNHSPSIWWAQNANADEESLVVVFDQSLANQMEQAGTSVLQRKRIKISSTVTVTKPLALIGNVIHFEQGASLIAPNGSMTLIAPKILNPKIDVSGTNGASGNGAGDSGQPGQNGGHIFVAAAEATNAEFVSHGGTGGNGKQGITGKGGRNGNCDCCGKWEKANNGGPGGTGGDAGAGGNGGKVEYFFRYGSFSAQAAPGKAGNHGGRGAGGPGGRGCSGLGGKQPTRSPGPDGLEGDPASDGLNGRVTSRKVSFREVQRAFNEWRSVPNGTIDQLQYEIRKLASVD